MLGISLDEKGIALIDYQNNGSPGAFAALARALDIPWLMFCDDDQGGRNHIREIENYSFKPDELSLRTQKLPGTDLEDFLTRHFPRELNAAAIKLGASFTLPPDSTDFVNNELVPFLKGRKTSSAALLVDALEGADPDSVPEFFKTLLQRCTEAADA
jgi:putative ATP-dependent endonuclease of OLD family